MSTWRAHFDYTFGNSLAGPPAAARRGFVAIDADVHITRDGYFVVAHWGRPLKHGWHDPLGLIHESTTIAQMTLAEVQRLRTRQGHQIQRLVDYLRVCAEVGMVACIEAKPDPRWKKKARWQQLKRIAESVGARVQGEAVASTWRGHSGRDAANRAAHRAGIPAWHRPTKETPVPKKPKPKGFIDLAIAYARRRGWPQRVRLLRQAKATRR